MERSRREVRRRCLPAPHAPCGIDVDSSGPAGRDQAS